MKTKIQNYPQQINQSGQAMTEYALVASTMCLNCLFIYEIMMRGLNAWIGLINYVLNAPMP